MNEYEEILNELVNKLGNNALKSSSTFKYIDDCAPKSDVLVRNRLKFVFISGIFSSFEAPSDTNNIIERLQNELFYPIDLAKVIISSFAKFLEIDVGLTLDKYLANPCSNIDQEFVYVEIPPSIAISANNLIFCSHQVTQSDFFKIMGFNPSKFRGLENPVESISLDNAIEYCNQLSQKEGLNPCYTKDDDKFSCDFSSNGYRLPTNREWLFAAMGGFKSKGYKYSGSNKAKDVAWYNKRHTYPVKQKRSNELGLYDMLGNVQELSWYYKSDKLGDQFNVLGGGFDTEKRAINFEAIEKYISSLEDYVRRYEKFDKGEISSCPSSPPSSLGSDDHIGFRVVRSCT